MKLSKLKEKLELKIGESRFRNLKKNFKNYKLQGKNLDLDKVKIIGITGSRGKSSTAFLVHKYLQLKGFKSILYSSISIDSPCSNIKKNSSCEIPINNETGLLNLLDEADCYKADYIIVEINESTISKGLVNDIPFDMRVLTNLNPKHNNEQYEEQEYVNLKKSFLKDVSSKEDCICVLGVQDYDKNLFNELFSINNCKKIFYSSEYIADVKNIDKSNINSLLVGLNSSLSGLDLEFIMDNKKYDLHTNLLMPHNSLNILGAITILNALGEYDHDLFKTYIKNVELPGRVEVIKSNGRTIIIDLFLTPTLEILRKFKEKGEVKNIRVITGAIGTNFKTWNSKFKDEKFISTRSESRKFAMNIVNKFADYVYITQNDNAAENLEDICKELQSYLETNVISDIIYDRKEAIKKAIIDSEKGDIIFVSGRGNRKILCVSETKAELLLDKDVVIDVLDKLGWSKYGL